MIRVVGVGGAGVNAVNRMVEAGIPASSSWRSTPTFSRCSSRTPTSPSTSAASVTRGLGAGSDPELGYRAAFEEQDKIKRLLKGSDMVFITAGAGGGTGTGAAPVVARLARDVGALTVGIVTKPFTLRGHPARAAGRGGHRGAERRGRHADRRPERAAAHRAGARRRR